MPMNSRARVENCEHSQASISRREEEDEVTATRAKTASIRMR